MIPETKPEVELIILDVESDFRDPLECDDYLENDDQITAKLQLNDDVEEDDSFEVTINGDSSRTSSPDLDDFGNDSQFHEIDISEITDADDADDAEDADDADDADDVDDGPHHDDVNEYFGLPLEQSMKEEPLNAKAIEVIIFELLQYVIRFLIFSVFIIDVSNGNQ